MYIITQTGFILLTIICTAIVLWGLNKILINNQTEESSRKAILLKIGFVIIGWAAISGTLAWLGFFSDFDTMPPKLFINFFIPLFLILSVLFSGKFTKLLKTVPPSWLMYIQGFRFFVEILLWMLFLDNLLPIQLTFEGRNWDVLAGITGPIFAYICFGNGRSNINLAIVWNFIGLALLVNIVAMAILSVPLPFRYFMNKPSNVIVATFPVVWLPGLLVPLAYSMHLFSLKQLFVMKKEKQKIVTTA
ncbi:MAG: hypothetical protein KTR26_03215 [Flammeovirgaceae bacterium]|nr:hypothetical protein [Flammeovirgaceae bacterium]